MAPCVPPLSNRAIGQVRAIGSTFPAACWTDTRPTLWRSNFIVVSSGTQPLPVMLQGVCASAWLGEAESEKKPEKASVHRRLPWRRLHSHKAYTNQQGECGI